MSKIKEFIFKYKITISIIVLLGLSFMIYFIVSANEDPYQNQIEVKNVSVSIEDGTPNSYDESGNPIFDSNDDPGNDNSDSNKIVRSFDSIIYNIDYTLGFKDGISDGDTSTDTTRNVIIDLLIPSVQNINVKSELSSTPEGSSSEIITINNVDYAYYELTYTDQSMINSNSINIVLSDINLKNGEKIFPIIRVRESTDEDVTNITDIEDLNSINILNSANDTITVTAVDKLDVKLYPGTIKSNKETGVTGIPIGILLYIPNDPIKGIKGVQVPSSIEYNLDIKYTEGDGNITYLDKGDYDQTKFTISSLYEFPNSYTGGKNSNIGYEEIETTSGYKKTYKIKFENINYNTQTVNINAGLENSEENIVTYVSSNIFAINSEKTVNSDATLEFKMNNSTTNVLDNYVPFVGDYLSKIDFINYSNITASSGNNVIFENSGEATYNYNEEFYIQDTITYGEKSGDVLNDGLTNYIKIDNSMVKLIDVGSLEDETLNYYVSITSSNENQNTDTSIVKASYGVGEWNASNFKIKEGAPSYCPKTTSKLSKESLMNYYGGPCIEEVEGKIEWFDSIDDAAYADENNRNKIIIFKLDFDDKYYPATKTIVRLKGKMVSNTSNVGKTTQIVSRGTTIDDGNIYYLSETPRKSVSSQEQDLNYIKTEYDSNYEMIEGTNAPSAKYGNTILVTPFKVALSDIEVRDKNDSLKNTIYSGITDPVSIRITPIISKSDPDATFKNLTLSIYLPAELELTTEKKDKVLTYIGEATINDRKYNEYQYIYSENDIKYGTASVVDSLLIHAYIDISVQDSTISDIIAIVDAEMKTNKDTAEVFESVSSRKSRTKSATVTLKNTNVISTIGKMLSSIYFEKNGEMIYNMRAANLSGTATNLSLVKVIPYSGDGLGEGSEFDGSISVRLEKELPTGYEVYYTKENSKTILNNELNSVNSNKWVKWTNYTKNTNGITAIKIVSTNKIKNNGYFVDKNGINLIMKTSENKDGNEYYNNFYMISNEKNICNGEENCDSTAEIAVPNASNISYASVYNRSISGYVFEDYDYNGFYDNGEKRLSNIAVEIYKVNSSDPGFDIGEIEIGFNTGSSTNSNDETSSKPNVELIGETTTDKNGYYSFKGIEQGNYYIKYTYDCDKYTLTEKNKIDVNLGDTSQIDSDASPGAGTCEAISNTISLDNNNVKVTHIDMGLRIRQNFGVTIKKYITNVVVNSNRGTESYDYDKESKVKIDVKNLKNTSFRVTYKFEIENSKYFPGTIGTIIDQIPDGMTFDSAIAANDGWYENNGKLYYSKLAGTLILPDEKYYMTLVLDLKTDNGGTYINFVSAQDLNVMETTVNLLEGTYIKDDNGNIINYVEKEKNGE